MKKFLDSATTRNVALTIAFLIILACGGSAPPDTETYPVSRAFPIEAVNNDTDNVHIFMEPATFGTQNRVGPNASAVFVSPSTSWDTANTEKTLRIVAGRSGSVIDSKSMTINGHQAYKTTKFQAIFNANQTLTVNRLE